LAFAMRPNEPAVRLFFHIKRPPDLTVAIRVSFHIYDLAGIRILPVNIFAFSIFKCNTPKIIII
jgi:hypothetical protein